MAVKVAEHHISSYWPYYLCLPLGSNFRQRYHILRLKMRRLLLLGQFMGSLDEQRLQKPTSQSNFSPSMDSSQHCLTFSKCSLMGMQEAIVQMLYFEFQRNYDSSVRREPIKASHFQMAELTPSHQLPLLSLHIELNMVLNPLYAFLIRTSATRSFTLKIVFSILGSSSASSWLLMLLDRSGRLQCANRASSLETRSVHVANMDSKRSCMLEAQLRLLIMAVRPIRMPCSRCPTTADNTYPYFSNRGQYYPTTSSTIRGVSSFLATNLCALMAMLCSYRIISLTSGKVSLRWPKLSESRMICVNFCSLRKQSSSWTDMALGSTYSASLFSPSNSSILRSSILTRSHSILSTLSLSRAVPSCSFNFANSCAMKSNLSLSLTNLPSISWELLSSLVSLFSTALAQRYRARSLVMNLSHSARNLLSSWAVSSSSVGGNELGGSSFSRKSRSIRNYKLIYYDMRKLMHNPVDHEYDMISAMPSCLLAAHVV